MMALASSLVVAAAVYLLGWRMADRWLRLLGTERRFEATGIVGTTVLCALVLAGWLVPFGILAGILGAMHVRAYGWPWQVVAPYPWKRDRTEKV